MHTFLISLLYSIPRFYFSVIYITLLISFKILFEYLTLLFSNLVTLPKDIEFI